MTWRWDQSAGELSHNGMIVARGYSGRGEGINNPAMEGVRSVGPVPRGRWVIRPPYNSRTLGRYVLPIWSADDGKFDDVHGRTRRSAFRIHGDNRAGNRTASKGCIILPLAIRQLIWQSGDRDLEVVA